MNTLKKMMAAMVLFCAMLLSTATLYAGEEGIKIGTLEINAVKGTRHNLIIRSSVDVEAVFTDSAGKKEYYIGEMGTKLGADISIKTEETLAYVVISAASEYKTGSYAMQGKYFGTKASAAVGAGLGVQLLIGGLEKSLTLQPIAVGGVEGIGASYGMGYLYLQKDPMR